MLFARNGDFRAKLMGGGYYKTLIDGIAIKTEICVLVSTVSDLNDIRNKKCIKNKNNSLQGFQTAVSLTVEGNS